MIGVVAGLDRRHHKAIGQPRVEGPIGRLKMERQTTLVAPALQLDHPITLPHRVPLHQRQSAGFRKQIHQHHRLMVDAQTVGAGDFAERLVPDIGPRRLEREIIVDPTRHAVSLEKSANRKSSQQTRRHDARSIVGTFLCAANTDKATRRWPVVIQLRHYGLSEPTAARLPECSGGHGTAFDNDRRLGAVLHSPGAPLARRCLHNLQAAVKFRRSPIRLLQCGDGLPAGVRQFE